MVHEVATTIASVPAQTLASRIRSVLTLDESRAFAQSTLPTLYLRSTDDRLVPDSAWRRMSRLRQIDVVLVPGPHLLLQVNPTAAWYNPPIPRIILAGRRIRDMKRIARLLLITAVLAPASKLERRRLSAEIILPGGGRLSTFLIECRSGTDQAIERFNLISAMRVDGTVVLLTVGSLMGGRHRQCRLDRVGPR
jgi:hypothetical protein